ncbi:MAG: hypothetical protein K8I82_15495 [Anaerolineae bacterium]|nr:hypothetical protein [Anaerolineae bacterium]
MTAQESISVTGSDPQWYWIFKLGGIAALFGVAMIPIQVIVYSISPPPNLINEWFILFQKNPLLGLLNLDMLFLINNILLIPIYLALCIALKPTRESIVIMALISGLVGIAAYIPSNTAFEMLKLSEQYTVGMPEAQQSIVLGAGQALIVQNSGTAFLVYYVLNAIALLLFAAAMFQSSVFSRNTAYAGITAGILMVVPSTFGVIGLIFSFLSLLPWALFSILIARTLFQLGRQNRKAATEIRLKR